MNFKNLLSCLFLSSTVFFVSCGGDDVDCTGNNAVTAINSEIKKVEDAQLAFIGDATNTDKCNAFKESINDFLDFIEPYQDCADLDQTSINSNVSSIKNSLSSLPCN